MSCCAPGAESLAFGRGDTQAREELLASAARDLGNGTSQLELTVPDVHCGACIEAIESRLDALEMVKAARVNLTARRVRIVFDPEGGSVGELLAAIHRAGYRAFVPDRTAEWEKDAQLARLVRSLAVAGFAATNIMLFSVSIWSGAEPATRDLFHWISALIAVPAVAYAGRPFFNSAWATLRQGTVNMDVPIALAVLLALALSLYETATGGVHAYFDASVTLLFFLLIGRTLDHLMREKARGAVNNLARLAPNRALKIDRDGRREAVQVAEVAPGMQLELAPGERVPVDATVIAGESDLDSALVSGETSPIRAYEGTKLLAGTFNLSGRLTIRAERPATDSFLARMIELMEAAEGARSHYRRIADRAAAGYAPVVHLLALSTFLGWGLWSGDWYWATTNAIAVLIITCPCALALAVPIVHVVAAGRLFEAGILMKDGASLERLAEVRHVAFDKTGTLTRGQPGYEGQLMGDAGGLAVAGRLAAASRHPFSQALAAAARGEPLRTAKEVPGSGVEAEIDGHVWRFGRADFCNATDRQLDSVNSVVWLSQDANPVAAFGFADPVRSDAEATIAALRQAGFGTTILSGDRPAPVHAVADQLQVRDARAELAPADKVAVLEEFAAHGEPALMVGDGLNDGPALAAAHVSIVPAGAADVGRSAADLVFTRDGLDAVPFALALAKRASRIVRQNFGLALAYNVVAVPLAVSGHVTPLVAALAMSSSSILVTLNALRLRLGTPLHRDVARDQSLKATRSTPLA